MRRVLVAALACALAGDAAAFTPAPALSFCGRAHAWCSVCFSTFLCVKGSCASARACLTLLV